MRPNWYIGVVIGGKPVVFEWPSKPTAESHGSLYAYAVGPFRTHRAALKYAATMSYTVKPTEG